MPDIKRHPCSAERGLVTAYVAEVGAGPSLWDLGRGFQPNPEKDRRCELACNMKPLYSVQEKVDMTFETLEWISKGK